MTQAQPLPRELVPGLFWLGDCLGVPWQGEILHTYNSVYVVEGTQAAMVIEAGIPKDLPVLMAQLSELAERNGPPVRYVFTTHAEVAHASGVGQILQRFPDAVLVGDVRDFHLIFPEYADRMRMLGEGDRVDLGGTEIEFVDAVIKDLNGTLWAFDTSRRVLFPGDGFAYSHYHTVGQCGHTAEEVEALPIAEMTALFADLALHWTRFVDMGPFVDRLDEQLRDLGVALVAPTHGLPITDLAVTMPKIVAGLLLGSMDPDAIGVIHHDE